MSWRRSGLRSGGSSHGRRSATPTKCRSASPSLEISGINSTTTFARSTRDALPLVQGTLHPSCARGAEVLQQALLKELFALYDITGEGSVTEWEFCVVEQLVDIISDERNVSRRSSSKRSLPGVMTETSQNILSCTSALPMRKSGSHIELPFLADSKLDRPGMRGQALSSGLAKVDGPRSTENENCRILATLKARFNDIDENRDGYIDFEEFVRWQKRVFDSDGSRRHLSSRQQDARLMIHELRNRQKNDARFGIWKQLWKDVGHFPSAAMVDRGTIRQDIERVQKAVEKSRKLLPAGKDCMLEAISEMLSQVQRECQDYFRSKLEEANTLSALVNILDETTALVDVINFPGEDMEFYCKKSSDWREPYSLHVSTLSGKELYVEVTRLETIATLKQKIADGLDMRPYRLTLATNAGSLESDSNTLEMLNLTPEHILEVGVTFNPVDRWKELTTEDAIALLVDLEIISKEKAAMYIEDNITGHAPLEGGATTKYVHKFTLLDWIPSILKAEEARAEKQRQAQEEVDRKRKIGQAARNHVDAICKSTQDSVGEEVAQILSCLECELSKQFHRKNELCTRREEMQKLSQQKMEALRPYIENFDSLERDISKKDIQELMAFCKPPNGVLLAAEALCIAFRVKPSWTDFMRSLAHDPRLLHRMREYRPHDSEEMPDTVAKKLRRYIDNPEFDINRLLKQSKFAHFVGLWIRMILERYDIAEIYPTSEDHRQLTSEIELADVIYDCLAAEVETYHSRVNRIG